MAKQYTGSLTLEWFNKQKALLNLSDGDIKSTSDIPAPRINWINRDEALYFQISEDEGKGNLPYWVDRNDIRVKESRPLMFSKGYEAISVDKEGTIPGTFTEFKVTETSIEQDVKSVKNILIKGDNLLALNAIKKLQDSENGIDKIKCIYIDPPYNTGSAFDQYDDNLAHSEWLTLMRDRLTILRDLLSDDGSIFVSIDNNESSYLQVLMDDIFGKENKKNIITLKRGSATGAKVINPGLVNISEFILVYSKNSDYWEPNRIYTKTERSDRYNQYIPNIHENCENWKFIPLAEAFAEFKGIDKKKIKNHLGKRYEPELEKFVLDHANQVIRFASLDSNSISKAANELKNKSKKDDSKVYFLDRENANPYYVYKGGVILFVKDRLQEIDGELSFSQPVTDIWMDVLPNDLHNEGGVDFRKGKKPEKLIQRILDFATNEGDLVLDCFGGSGSTFAVAHKMNRKWIGIEIGNHADTHIIPRLISVLDGSDKSGITSTVNWLGGGAFKYYHLGESIINVDSETGKGEFNWSLGKKFIQESLLISYDFILQKEINLFPAQLFPDTKDKPTLGKISVNNMSLYGVAYLADPKDSNLTITNEEVKMIYSTLKKQDDFKGLAIYTNKGIDIAQDTIPEDLDIIKVPHAVFAELER